MAYRGGGGRGAPAGGGRGATRWPPPRASSAPRPAATAPVVADNPNAAGPHQGAYQHGVVVRNPALAPYATVRAPSPAVTIRAPSPTPATIRATAPTPSPAPAPFQPARVSAPAPAPPTPAAVANELEHKIFNTETVLARPAAAAPFQPARVSAPAPAPPTPASVAKELEQKLFVTETALAPPAAAAAAAVAATQPEEEKAPDVDLAPVSKKGLAHPARPGAGTVGKKVMIRANHLLVNVADNNLFHYDVSINPESKSRAVNREVLSELIKLHGKTSLGGKLPAYDGRKSLYTAGSLPFESEEFSVTLVDPEKKDKEKAEREYKITIRIAGRTDLYHLQQFLKGRQRDMPQETIQVLDVVLRESPSWNYVTVSRSFFSTTFGHRGDIGEGLECWRGYYQSLRPTQMGLSLNIDISATSFFKPVTVVQFVLEFLNLRDASRPLTDRDRVKIKKALRGVRVETNHQEDQIRRYKITGITPVPMSQLIFPIDERGTRMSVVQYFMQRYNYNLQYTSWPCLQSGSDARPVYLPMEACKIVEGQRYSKKLNDKQVTNILRATCQRPQQREQSIREMVLHNKYAEDKFAQEFGINVCSDLVSVPARVLPPPMLRFHDSGKEKTCAPSVGQWNMINKKMINGGIIDNWACVSFSRMRPEEVHRFCCDLIQMCNMTGMVGRPPSIEKAFTRFGVPSVKNIPTIIFGADVTHPPPGEDSASSIAAVVASMDWPEITKYSGLVSAQPHRQEIIEDLFSVTKVPQRGNVNGGMIRELLIAFRRKTGRRPERILFFRDGVSEGQFSHVLLHEMDAIRKACASLEEGYQPEVNFVPVEKKHYTRLLSEDHGRHDMTDKSGNKLPGLVTAHENNGQHRPINIFIDCPAGRLVVQVPLSSTCYSLKTAIEKKLNVSINSCSLYLVRKPINYGKTLSYYGLRDESVLRMEAKLLGGASIGVPQTVAQTFSDQNLKEYSADSTKFFRNELVRDKDWPGRKKLIRVFNKKGNILGLSVLDQLKKAIKEKKSWDGQLKKKDFRVVDGRAVIIKKPIYNIDAVNFPKDCKKIRKILKKIFQTEISGADAPFLQWNPFLRDLLEVLELATFSDLYWLVPFIKTNFAFKTPIQRENASYNIVRYYEGLNWQDKANFEAIVDGVTVPPDWRSCKVQTHYFFRKTIQYAFQKFGCTYSLSSFGCFKFQRNHATHAKVSPFHLSDHEITMFLRSFVAEVIRGLLKKRVPIKKALQ
ncbi:protein argonaute MEL1 [Triticum aestivum]|uniref:protein argonaute MEL1 n=1 Tax=Triticum aestivum TaxID=4565 RepID=UPI001D02C4B9|nr:protein argonaute MEL1-like [Triticum aestivum]